MKSNYIHFEIPKLSSAFLHKGNVHIGPPGADEMRPLEVALGTLNLALRLGIAPPSASGPDELPYAPQSAALIFQAPILSALTSKKIAYLRGWKQFDSCIKGFNSLGLMAEQVRNEISRLGALPLSQQNELKLEFLRSRRSGQNPVYTAAELDDIGQAEFFALDNHDIAVWRCFADKTIVCSTSSNMGVSTHQALRLMQKSRLGFRGKEFSLLNESEGRLVVWCPDERADFMNAEKARLLRSLEQDLPAITTLRTYINRQQRDPGALKDALTAGGYFFPTNPQSKDEMQNLVFVALGEIAKERSQEAGEILKDPRIRRTLESLDCEIERGQVTVRSGVEGGIYGLMVPYLAMLEELMAAEPPPAVSLWNQASIGAALAAAALADKILREPEKMRDDVRSRFNSHFPSLSKFLDTRRIGKDVATQIHGVFDIANLQSLAQLLGVVVENHQSGRGTAYVGLGSSSYSNGNRCIEILRESISSGGAFRGKDAFHPATHTLNPFAQALVFGEDLQRWLRLSRIGPDLTPEALSDCMVHVKKPEPAGAAALAGYLLSRLDMQTLSLVEIAYCLRLMGFSQTTFLQFSGCDGDGRGLRKFIQSASEEGPLMESVAQNMLLLLDWSIPDLEKHLWSEKKRSRVRYWQNPLDEIGFEYLGGKTCVCLTGDNATQISPELTRGLAEAGLKNRPRLEAFLTEADKGLPRRNRVRPADLACLAVYRAAKAVNSLTARIEKMGKDFAHRRLSGNDS